MGEVYLTTGEAAKRLYVSRQTVLQWIESGHIRPGEYIRPGGWYRIAESAVERLLRTPGTE